MTLRFDSTAPFAGPACLILCLALAACGGQSQGGSQDALGGAPPPLQAPESLETGVVPGPGPKAASPLPAPAPERQPAPLDGNTRIKRELAEGGRSLRVLVEGLRPADEVEAIVLEGPSGQRVEAGPSDIRDGTRLSGGGSDRPRVSVRGGNNDPLGVTMMLDVFSTRPEPQEERESRLAWAYLPLPDPAAYAADPAAWRVTVALTDEVGGRRELSD